MIRLAKVVRRELWAIIISIALSYVAGMLGFFTPFERLLFGLLQTFESRAVDHVTIVDVNEQDFQMVFGGTRPLDPAILHCTLLRILAGGARTIVVDIDTSLSLKTEAELAESPPGCAASLRPATAADLTKRLVWAVDAWNPNADIPVKRGVLQSLRGLFPGATLDAPLELSAAIPVTGEQGLAGVVADQDGVVRRYSPYLPVTGRGLFPTLPMAAVSNFCRLPPRAALEFRPAKQSRQGSGGSAEVPPRGCKAVHSEQNVSHETLIDFSGPDTTFHFSISTLQMLSENAEWLTSAPIRDKIVLLGGTFRDAREERFSTAGPMPGVDILAQTIESELESGGIPESHTLNLALDLVFAIGTVLLFDATASLRRAWRVLIPTVISIGIMITGWLVLYSARLMLISVPALLFSLWVHQRRHHAGE